MSKSIFKNSIYKILLNVFNLFVPILVMPYVSSLLDTERYGVYNTAHSILTTFLVFAVFGIYNYGIKEISRVRDRREELERLFVHLFLFGIITSLSTAVAYFLYVTFFVDAPSRGIYYVLIIQIVGNIFAVEWINEAVEEYGFITKKTILVRIAYVASVFVFVRKEEDIIPYALVFSLAAVINNLVSFLYVKRRVRFSFTEIHLGRYVKPLVIFTLISNVNILYVQLDAITLGKFVSPIANTEYTLPANIINMLGVMINSLLFVAIPRLNYYFGNGMQEDYLALLKKSARAFFSVLCPACIGLCCLSPEAMYLYTGGKYTYAWPVLSVFALRFLVASLYAIFVNQILYVYRKENVAIRILAIGGGINLLFKIVLLCTHRLTPVIAIASTGCAECIMLTIMYVYIRRVLRVEFSLFSFDNLRYLCFSLPFFLITAVVKPFSLGVIANCAILIPACSGLYLLLLFLFKDEMLYYFKEKLFGRFRRSGKVE